MYYGLLAWVLALRITFIEGSVVDAWLWAAHSFLNLCFLEGADNFDMVIRSTCHGVRSIDSKWLQGTARLDLVCMHFPDAGMQQPSLTTTELLNPELPQSETLKV
jgi:hypothetical protein